ncbi:hypothetical protein BpHYR1_037312 [Brachionus plicatilis]|uniref:Uncharacterized protein n=1 Tax=Brachionus plicatilis TaxID=10195 RepID=A0A3M7RXU8_BRAPC|nr:hypothetical protein BpHYR1_037312 [Brachionus plicatilis]
MAETVAGGASGQKTAASTSSSIQDLDDSRNFKSLENGRSRPWLDKFKIERDICLFAGDTTATNGKPKVETLLFNRLKPL